MTGSGVSGGDRREGPGEERWFVARERAVYIPAADALVLADLHLGRGRTSNVSLALPEFDAIEERLGGLLDAFDPGTVVVAGDVCHAFSTVPEGVPDALAALDERVRGAGADLVLVAGNHDATLDSLADPVPEHPLDDGTLVHHGHEHPEGDADRYVIGHEHPAIEIEGRRHPCLLWGAGAYRGGDVLALPAFTDLAAGTVVNGLRGRDTQSPLLSSLGAFRPVVRNSGEGETLVFPPLSALRARL
ncbi:MAG: metallophosphoesterase [Halobacteriales archaeon]